MALTDQCATGSGAASTIDESEDTSEVDDAQAAYATATRLLRTRSNSITSIPGGLAAGMFRSNTVASSDADFGDYSYKNLNELRRANRCVSRTMRQRNIPAVHAHTAKVI